MRSFIVVLTLFSLLAASCGGSDSSSTEAGDSSPDAAGDVPGIRLVTPAEGAAVLDDPPDDLVVLDVRTLEEFTEGHIDGATMIDFYGEDFADQLAELDPNDSYLLYCRSGNRSGQAAALMEQLGFTDVADVQGGIVAWGEADLPTVTP